MSVQTVFNNCMAIWTAFPGEMPNSYTTRSYTTPSELYDILCAEGWYIACGEQGVYYTDTPMSTWTWLTVDTTCVFQRIAVLGTTLTMMGYVSDTREIVIANATVSGFRSAASWTITHTGRYGNVEDLVVFGGSLWACGGIYVYPPDYHDQVPFVAVNGVFTVHGDISPSYSGRYTCLLEYGGAVRVFGYASLGKHLTYYPYNSYVVFTPIGATGTAAPALLDPGEQYGYIPTRLLEWEGRLLLLSAGSTNSVWDVTAGTPVRLARFGFKCWDWVVATNQLWVSSISSSYTYLYRSGNLTGWVAPRSLRQSLTTNSMLAQNGMLFLCGTYTSSLFGTAGKVIILKLQ